MLKQAVIQDIHQGRLTQADGYLVITTRFYPRFLAKRSIDEYVASLAPTRELLREFKEAAEEMGHNPAFLHVDYQRRFDLSAEGVVALQRLTLLSTRCSVYLGCFCARDEYCHRELLLLMAHAKFGAEIEPVNHDYGVWRERIKD